MLLCSLQATIFASASHLEVDERRWDTSDFRKVDKNRNVVSYRTCLRPA